MDWVDDIVEVVSDFMRESGFDWFATNEIELMKRLQDLVCVVRFE